MTGSRNTPAGQLSAGQLWQSLQQLRPAPNVQLVLREHLGQCAVPRYFEWVCPAAPRESLPGYLPADIAARAKANQGKRTDLPEISPERLIPIETRVEVARGPFSVWLFRHSSSSSQPLERNGLASLSRPTEPIPHFPHYVSHIGGCCRFCMLFPSRIT